MKKFDAYLTFTAWTYLLCTILALALMYLTGDRWWPGTLLLFGPRWMLALPLIPLLPLALWRRPRILIPLILGGAIVIGPFMGLQWSFFQPRVSNDHVLRILTCNVQTGSFEKQSLVKLIEEKSIDLLTLQECPPDVNLVLPEQWHRVQAGLLLIASKYPLQAHEAVMGTHPPHVWPRHSLLPCSISTPWGKVVFASTHLPSPRYGLQHVLDRKTLINPMKADMITDETTNRRIIASSIQKVLNSQTLPVIVAGDFNMSVESTIYREHWSDFTNAYSEVGHGFGWSYQDSPFGVPMNIRIDHILSRNGAVPLTCEVGPDVGSDHKPLIADIAILTKGHD